MNEVNTVERPVKPRHAALVPVHQGQQRALASVAAGQRKGQLARRWYQRPSAAWCGLPRLSRVPVRFASEARKEPRQPQLRGGSCPGDGLAIFLAAVRDIDFLEGPSAHYNRLGFCFSACGKILLCIWSVVFVGGARCWRMIKSDNAVGDVDVIDRSHDVAFLAILRVPYCPAHVLIIGQQTRIARTICKPREIIF